MERVKDGRKDAYFTVEAALIVPAVLGILVMIIYLSFYLYDRCVLSQDCYVLSYRQSIEKAGRDRAGDKEAVDQLRGRAFMLSGPDTDSSEGGTVEVRAGGRMDPPLIGLPFFEDGEEWELSVQMKARKTDPPKDYRRVRRIMNLAGRIKNE